MSEFEDKLNSILSSPAEMDKILGMARSLSESMGAGEKENAKPKDFVSSAAALGDIDPKIFKLMTTLITEYSSSGNDKKQLLNAMKPYLKEDRHQQIDKAYEIAKLAHVAKIAFSEFSGGDKDI